MGDRAAKDQLFEAFASITKAVSSARRLETIDVLAQGPRSVEEIAREIDQSVANTSHHLKALAGGGLVRSRREGTRIIYSLASESIEDLWRAVRAVAAERVAGIDRLAADYLGDRESFEPLSREELSKLIRRGEVTVIDVRPAAEYRSGHIRGARSVPLAELSRRLREIPKGSKVVAYCRGPYCVYADDAVRMLSKKGFKAQRLGDGFPEWRRAGLPVASGDQA